MVAAANSKQSPAYELLAHVWKHEGHGKERSWNRINDAMYSALKLAIRSGMKFHEDDFKSFANDFNSAYWIGEKDEFLYALAIGESVNSHGPNTSAYQAYEKWRGRKAFIVRLNPNDNSPKRLSVEQRFRWADGDRLAHVIVTSFNDAKGECIACEYSDPPHNRKVSRRFTITHEQIRAYHARLAGAKKPKLPMTKPAETINPDPRPGV